MSKTLALEDETYLFKRILAEGTTWVSFARALGTDDNTNRWYGAIRRVDRAANCGIDAAGRLLTSYASCSSFLSDVSSPAVLHVEDPLLALIFATRSVDSQVACLPTNDSAIVQRVSWLFRGARGAPSLLSPPGTEEGGAQPPSTLSARGGGGGGGGGSGGPRSPRPLPLRAPRSPRGAKASPPAAVNPRLGGTRAAAPATPFPADAALSSLPPWVPVNLKCVKITTSEGREGTVLVPTTLAASAFCTALGEFSRNEAERGGAWAPGVVTAFFPSSLAAAAAAASDCASGMGSAESAESALARHRGVEGLLLLKRG